jgi:DNA repair and recombination RAD54-like protein
MLRRVPTTPDGQVVDRLQESTRINKPFKQPTFAATIERAKLRRQKRRVSYHGQQADGDDDDKEEESTRKKNKQRNGDNRDRAYTEEDILAAIPKFPVYKPKPFEQIFGSRRFSMPSMRSKTGELLSLVPSYASLGLRPQTKIAPRPLHDPMEDHAIVLYDPTVDNRETDEERREREVEEAKEKAAMEAREKTAGMYNPHKNLRDLLGEGRGKEKQVKVPVVIDPRLAKVLRPHQVEGVKVSTFRC